MKFDRSNISQRRLYATASVIAIGIFFSSSSFASLGNAGQKNNSAAAPQPGVLTLMSKARDAMKQGHPEVAVIYLQNAEAMEPELPILHFQLGQAFLGSGNPAEAERELRDAQQRGISEAQVLPLILAAMVSLHENEQILRKYPEPATGDHSALAGDIFRARASAQVDSSDKAGAAKTLDNALAAARTAQNLTARAQLAHDMRDDVSAAKLVDEALTKEPGNPKALLMKVAFLQKAKQWSKALSYANTLIKVTHGSSLAVQTRAGIYMQGGQDANALTDLNTVLAASPNLPLAMFYKALLRAKAKDIAGAWTLAQTLPLAFSTSQPDIGMAVSQMAIDAGHRETATNILSSTVQAFPNNPDARIRLGMDYLALKEPSNAVATLSPLAQSSDPRIAALLGESYALQKDYAQSLKYFAKANAAGFGGDGLKLKIAMSNFQQGNTDAAAKSLQELIVKQPGNTEIVGPYIALKLRKGDFDAAMKAANQLASLAPKSSYGPLYQGQILAQKGDTDGAIKALSLAIARDPKSVPALYNRALAFATRGDAQAAQSDLKSILAADPKNVMATISLAQLSSRSGQNDKVLPLLKSAVQANPNDPSANMALAEYYLQQNRPKDAMAAVNAFLQLVPNNLGGMAMLGNIQLVSGAADDAIKTFGGLQKANPKSAEIQLLLAHAYQKKGDVKATTAAYQKAIQLDPKLSNAWGTLIQYQLSNKNINGALATAQSFALQQPGRTSAQTLAAVLDLANKGSDAESVLAKSLADQPNNAIALQLAAMLRKHGKVKQADDTLTSWLGTHPDDTDVRVAYSVSQLSRNPALAQQQLQMVLQKQPYNLAALNNLAWVLREKDPKTALGYAEKAQKITPKFPAVLDTLGWIKFQLNDRATALALLQQARAGDSNDSEIAYHLAVVLNGAKRTPEAKQLLASALSNSGDFEDRPKALALSAQLH